MESSELLQGVLDANPGIVPVRTGGDSFGEDVCIGFYHPLTGRRRSCFRDKKRTDPFCEHCQNELVKEAGVKETPPIRPIQSG